ncbi:MAG TPA: rRNA maturation RNase YbeY [Syntrophales bacterium]|nr:rRNA maturation RNase YbeY [Syntrophales bacterium]
MDIWIENRQKKEKIDRRRVRSALRKALHRLGRDDAEVSLLFLDDEGIREINRTYLNRDYPTNVISFSMTEGPFGDLNPRVLGDIVISVERSRAEALESGLAPEDYQDFLIIHGLLHLLGYDHESPREEDGEHMREMEREIFRLIKGYRIGGGD